MPHNTWTVNRDRNRITTSSTVFTLTPQQERQRQAVNRLISSLPAYQQRSIKALGLHMSEQLLSSPISEAGVRNIMVDNMKKVAEITHPRTAQMLLDHTNSSLFFGMLTQIEQMDTKISKIQEIVAALREEIVMLKDEIASWPDSDAPRRITYRLAAREPDGSWKLTEQTRNMSKREVQDLIDTLEVQINEISKMLETHMLEIQDAMIKQAQQYQVVSNILLTMHSVAEATIRNMRP